MYINSIIHLKLISRISQVIFVFISKILFLRRMLCLMDKNGNLCPSKNVTLAYQHVSYLENDLVLMAQFLPHFPSANMFSLNSKIFPTSWPKKSYFEKCVFHILL